jgi:hypothetical protein
VWKQSFVGLFYWGSFGPFQSGSRSISLGFSVSITRLAKLSIGCCCGGVRWNEWLVWGRGSNGCSQIWGLSTVFTTVHPQHSNTETSIYWDLNEGLSWALCQWRKNDSSSEKWVPIPKPQTLRGLEYSISFCRWLSLTSQEWQPGADTAPVC